MLKSLLKVLALFYSVGLTRASCSETDFITVYTGDDNMEGTMFHEVVYQTYAVDFATGDMVVAGGVRLVNSTDLTYLYYMDGANCEVKWHYFLPESWALFSREIVSLELRSDPSRIFGLTKTDKQYMFFDIRNNLHWSETLVMEEYTLDEEPVMLLAPSASESYILAMSTSSVMSLGLGSNRWTTGISQTGSAENKAFAKSTEEALFVAVNEQDEFKVQKYTLPLASETSLVASYQLEPSVSGMISFESMHISVYHDSAS